MAHSIELLLDDHSDAAIRTVWHRLEDAGLPSQLRVKSATNRPHVTLLAAERIAADVDDELTQLRARFPLPVVVGAPLIFGGGKLTLARLVVASADLLALHRDVVDRCLPHLPQEPYAHSAPGTGRRTSPSGGASPRSRWPRRSRSTGCRPTSMRGWSACAGGTATSASSRC